MRRWMCSFAAIAFVLGGLELPAGEPPRVSLVPWKVIEPGSDPGDAPLALLWIPASREELRRSDLLTSEELLLFSSQCVAMRVLRGDDQAMLAALDVEDELPVALLVDESNHVLGRVAAEHGELPLGEVEAMVRDELDQRTSAADKALDEARQKAEDGDVAAAVSIYTAVWEQRCVCPRQGRDAQRALKKLRR